MAKDEGKSIHSGHRERLRARFMQEGLASFSEHEVLELLLTYAIPQRDVNPLAHDLIDRFGRLSQVLEADVNELTQVSGVGERAALLLTMMPQLMRYYHMNALGERPVITNYDEAKRYCAPLFTGQHDELLFMICMDQSGRVTHRSLLQSGTIDEVAIYPRRIVEIALQHNAHGVLLCHNHPGGHAEPSQADIDSTMRLAWALAPIGIRLVDHLIFSGDCTHSMIRESQFTDPLPPGNFSYVMNSRNVPGRRGTLREAQNVWLHLLSGKAAFEEDP